MEDLVERTEEHLDATSADEEKKKSNVTAKDILKSCSGESYLYMGDNVTGHC